MAEQRVVAYAADTMDSVKTLELTCERDEAKLTSRVVSLQLASIDTTDGQKVTAVTYEEEEEIQVGHLIFEEYKTEVDVSRLKLLHHKLGEPLRGEAFIQDGAVKVLVFRELEQ